MNDRRFKQVSLAVSLTTLAVLTTEMLLIRVFDVILLTRVGYAVITLAMFASGLSGVFATIRPLSTSGDIARVVPVLSLLFGVALVLIRPVLNLIPPMYANLPSGVIKQTAGLVAIYPVLFIPFFVSGVIMAYVFSAAPDRIRRLYFWDLSGAALGCVAFLPFLRWLGPGGLLFWTAAASVLASALFAGKRTWSVASVCIATGLVLAPVLKSGGYFEFRMHADKRGVASAQLTGDIEFSEWGPISKIDVVASRERPWQALKAFQYDGGSQSSTLFPFDGNYDRLRQQVLTGFDDLRLYFWRRGVLVSHYLKRDTGAEVLIVGSAAGQETRAALLFNPSRVQGVEMVDTVVRLGRERYAPFIGHIFNDLRVRVHVGEGRHYLRATTDKYDILQIFSNHLTSNVAAGFGATTPVYLQTVEAYIEYFSHLKEDGILHINHHFYPRMITTAARAWTLMGRHDFQRHVLVHESSEGDTLTTMLIKASPWTAEEVEEVKTFLAVPDGYADPGRMVVDPMSPESSFLTREFFSGDLSDEFLNQVDYQVAPTTDDRPYFNNIQKTNALIELNPKRFVDHAMLDAVNSRLRWTLGEYTIFAAIGFVGLFLSAFVVLVPIMLSQAGKESWPGKFPSLAYFACLGAGFIAIELTLIQICMKFIGFPLYTSSVVIFTVLAGAALGSMAADRFEVTPARRWAVPFVGVLMSGGAFLGTYSWVFDQFALAPTAGRLLVCAVMIAPLAFFLGMPFPLGILSLERRPRGSVAWAWGINALFTVIGGTAAGVLSIWLGFRLTLLLAFGVYLAAFALFRQLRRAHRRADVATTEMRMPRAVGA